MALICGIADIERARFQPSAGRQDGASDSFTSTPRGNGILRGLGWIGLDRLIARLAGRTRHVSLGFQIQFSILLYPKEVNLAIFVWLDSGEDSVKAHDPPTGCLRHSLRSIGYRTVKKAVFLRSSLSSLYSHFTVISRNKREELMRVA